jgi:hypothetical protein
MASEIRGRLVFVPDEVAAVVPMADVHRLAPRIELVNTLENQDELVSQETTRWPVGEGQA